ncbi:class I SAM-dependent methyltransferase [Acidithrix ferrooxidans]|uniref:Cephalosporin hydroxylase n=1 Tax=Acidithrix ferrooxidans TaxID=1280514 RepID=A0A0D8HJ53_9ACTN|nr:class I SAM-dependent methyltransferase [Acidithrix ferrooxidans]KJF17884.1 hypothetical protein AXFE_11660 [Acidithrix ferrooxidans]
MSNYEFTNNWFQGTTKPVWDAIFPQLNPRKLLEVGSFEGAATTYIVETVGALANVELHAIDTWIGGIEHMEQGLDMSLVEKRFLYNIELARNSIDNRLDLHIHKGTSDFFLSKLFAMGLGEYFDFIYVDGSHQAPDVLTDAVLSPTFDNHPMKAQVMTILVSGFGHYS